MKIEKIQEIAENVINGNVSDAKKAIKRMNKAEFIDFAEYMRGFGGKKLYQLRYLVK